MTSWQEMSLDNFRAAKELIDNGRYRSSISRAYYAVFCALASEMEGKVDFPGGWNNPSHEQLIPVVRQTLPFGKGTRKMFAEYISELYKRRVDSDYRPRTKINRNEAEDCFRKAGAVLQRLGVKV